MRAVFLGNDPWSVPSLVALAGSRHRVVRVVTRVPRPAGRGSRLTPTAVSSAARELGLPLAEVETVKAGLGREALDRDPLDALVVVAYGEILPREILSLPAVAPVNVHFSLLPALRGAAPVQRALLDGLPLTGVTTIRMDEGMDTGPILLQAAEPVRPDDDAGSLGERLAALGGRLLIETLDGLEAGNIPDREQDHANATVARKLTAADREIDWREDPPSVVRRVRALAPEPGAATRFRGRRLKILRASVAEQARPAASDTGGTSVGGGVPGAVLAVGKDGPRVRAGEGSVLIQDLALEGRARMSGRAFLNGYRPRVGEVLG